MKRIKVMVLMGGQSSEREISLITGKGVFDNLNRKKYEVETIELPGGINKINEKNFEIAFLALHGKGGEDGIIQGYLETLGIKYTGSGVLASAIGMDKRVFRDIMTANGILMPKLTNKAPCVVKPVNGGSSIGVSIVKMDKDLSKSILKAKKYDNQILIEEYIKGRELTCGILGDEVLPVVEIKSRNEFFDYQSKYEESGAEEICPAEISTDLKNKIQKISKKVFELIGGRGYGRVDLIERDGEVYVLEINTLPGLTPNSLLPKEAKAAGYSYSEMLDKMIELAMK